MFYPGELRGPDGDYFFNVACHLAIFARKSCKKLPLFNIRRQIGYQVAFGRLFKQAFNSRLEVLHDGCSRLEHGRERHQRSQSPMKATDRAVMDQPNPGL
jgi:hypothetical protein